MHLESFRAVRWVRTVNLLLQAVLILSLFGGLNYIALHYSWRFDLTRNNRHSLSSETIAYLEGLKRPVRVVVTLPEDHPDQEMLADIRGLLREYAFAAEAAGNTLRIDHIDPFQRPAEAEALGIREPNTIFFLCGDRRRGVAPDELYRSVDDRRESLAEQVFTAAILDVSAEERRKLYFLTGHGEFQPDDVSAARGLSVLRDQLRVRNFAVATLDLTQQKRVPDDAALVVIAAPDRVEPFAEEQLRQYLRERAGRALVLLAPRTQHGLTDLLLDWGVMPGQNDILVDPSPENTTEEGNLRINAFSSHPITQTLIDHQLPVLVGMARSVAPAPGIGARSGTTTTLLAATSETAWGETGSNLDPRQGPQAGDVRGTPRLGFAIASERIQPRGNLPFTVRGGRLVVIGSADLAANGRLSGNPGNLSLLLNAVNWTVDRDVQLAILPRPIEKFQLSLSQQQLSRLRLALLVGVPGLAALLGIAVYWTRRS